MSDPFPDRWENYAAFGAKTMYSWSLILGQFGDPARKA
jgi:hypothetical protein